MDALVDCVDRWGRRIVLTEAQWRTHVVDGHPPLVGQEEAVRAALTAPERVMLDADHADRENFYRRGALAAPHDHLYLKVTVDFAATRVDPLAPGFVVTAFPTDHIRRRERSKWRR